MNTQRLAWYLVRIHDYSCQEANEPVFTLRDVQAEFKVKYPKVMSDLRTLHHLLEISLVPYPIREPIPSRGKKRARRTKLVDVLFMPKIRSGCFVTFTDKTGHVRTLEAHGKYGNSFLHRQRCGFSYKTIEIYNSSIIDVSYEQ